MQTIHIADFLASVEVHWTGFYDDTLFGLATLTIPLSLSDYPFAILQEGQSPARFEPTRGESDSSHKEIEARFHTEEGKHFSLVILADRSKHGRTHTYATWEAQRSEPKIIFYR